MHFLEIVLVAADNPFEGRAEVEIAVNADLSGEQLGEVTGGSTDGKLIRIQVDVRELEKGLNQIKRLLERLHASPNTIIIQYKPVRIVHRIYGLPPEAESKPAAAPTGAAPAARRRRNAAIAVGAAVLAIAAVGIATWLPRSREAEPPPDETDPEAAEATEDPGKQAAVGTGEEALPEKRDKADYWPILGHWVREDAKLEMGIVDVDEFGRIQLQEDSGRVTAISRATASVKDKDIFVHIKCDGGTYNLVLYRGSYDLVGHFNNAKSNDTYRVSFVRKK